MAETELNNNILNSVKEYCGISIDSDVTAYDSQIMSHINTVLMMLNQMGIGDPAREFRIKDGTETWDQLIQNDKYSGIKDYVNIKTKLLFDPQSFTPNAMSSTEELLKEIEWRLSYQADADAAGIPT